ncbi:MAG: DUF1289 domain-containing protein [Fimbriimonadaceae bacterium]|nr:DUF1289 domain-containing protein [Fimbriimonadaceae bacterium]QYK56977.1 MAG: DUF1289 domain-containing protein [Fimbriimonadaceae bacterium]
MGEVFIPSPCTGVCRLDPEQVCQGCGRTIAEICAWTTMTPEERKAAVELARGRLAGMASSAPAQAANPLG